MAEVFISYARADQGFARDLNNALQKLKRETWIDWRSIPDSSEWRPGMGLRDNLPDPALAAPTTAQRSTPQIAICIEAHVTDR